MRRDVLAHPDIKDFPSDPINPNPYHKYPKFVQVQSQLPEAFKTGQDLQQGGVW